MATLQDKQRYCRHCRDDFYNKPGNALNGQHCWNLPDAKIVTRFRLHWWTTPDTPRAYTEVVTLSCHREPGQFAFHERLPPFAVDPILLSEDERALVK